MTTDQIRDRERRQTPRPTTENPPSPRADSLPRRVGDHTQTAPDTEPVPDTEAAAIRSREAAIDAALEMTFPASDPPSWTL